MTQMRRERERAEAEGGAGAVGAAEHGDHKADDTKQPDRHEEEVQKQHPPWLHNSMQRWDVRLVPDHLYIDRSDSQITRENAA